jgi:hypothetical protein
MQQRFLELDSVIVFPGLIYLFLRVVQSTGGQGTAWTTSKPVPFQLRIQFNDFFWDLEAFEWKINRSCATEFVFPKEVPLVRSVFYWGLMSILGGDEPSQNAPAVFRSSRPASTAVLKMRMPSANVVDMRSFFAFRDYRRVRIRQKFYCRSRQKRGRIFERLHAQIAY